MRYIFQQEEQEYKKSAHNILFFCRAKCRDRARVQEKRRKKSFDVIKIWNQYFSLENVSFETIPHFPCIKYLSLSPRLLMSFFLSFLAVLLFSAFSMCKKNWNLGSLKLVFILLGVLGVASLASIIYCFWTTRRSAGSEQRRLTNDNNLLNQSDFDVLVSVACRCWCIIPDWLIN